MLPESNGSMSELISTEWYLIYGGPRCHRVSMMPEVTQTVEASEVVFGGQQGSLVQYVSVLMPEAVQAIEASGIGIWWSTRQQLKYPVYYQMSIGSLCIHARDVIKDSIEAG